MSDDAPQKLKPGQKFPTPTPGNGDRVFYETLLSQRPSSEMAEEWCLAYGVMDEADAAKALKRVTKRKGAARSRSPPPPPSKSAKKRKKSSSKKGKKVLEDAAYDAGMDAGGDEGVGTTALS